MAATGNREELRGHSHLRQRRNLSHALLVRDGRIGVSMNVHGRRQARTNMCDGGHEPCHVHAIGLRAEQRTAGVLDRGRGQRHAARTVFDADGERSCEAVLS